MKIAFILLMLVLLNGCAAALIGGAGGGGYYVGKDERDAGTIMNDASITSSINAKFLTTKGVSTFDINVDTYNGVVTLEGEVSSRKIKMKVINISKKTDDVVKVISKLKIKKE